MKNKLCGFTLIELLSDRICSTRCCRGSACTATAVRVAPAKSYLATHLHIHFAVQYAMNTMAPLAPFSPRNASLRVIRQAGFTLIELMITVAIIGILAGIALPSYNDYIRRGQVVEATTFLSDYRVKMEQYYQDYKNYGVSGTCVNGTNAPAWAVFAASKYFTYSCALTNTDQGYTITATGSAAAAVGHSYTVNESNVQATTQFKGATVTGKTCWLMKGSEC